MLVENIILPPQIFMEILQTLGNRWAGPYTHYLATVTCNRKKSLIVSERTIDGEGLGDFFKHLGSAAKNVGKKILNNPGRALEIAANIGTAAASKNPRMIAATAPDIIKFVHQGKGLYKAEGLREGLSSKGSKAGSKAGNTSNTNRKARTNGKGLYLGKIH